MIPLSYSDTAAAVKKGCFSWNRKRSADSRAIPSVLDPHKVSRISAQGKSKISEDKTQGDPEVFMAVWREIEENVYRLREELARTVRVLPGGRRKPQLVQTMEILRNYGKINYSLWKKLDKLRKYHNLSLHDLNLAVSQEMCDLARDVLKELEIKNGK